MHPAALATRSIGVLQQPALAWCIIFKCLHATEQHIVCHPKWRRAVANIAYTSRGISYARNCFVYYILAMCINYATSVINWEP
jgi:hypothetical protein